MKKSSTKKNTENQVDKLLTIVGIGASAGGLNALKSFFKEVPEDSGLAYVVVVHLSPEHKSMLPELLQPYCNIPVHQVTETEQLEPNHVFVIPPGANLNTIDSHLRLSKPEDKHNRRTPIDHFLRTLARTHDSNAIGVILTGTGSDGASGVKEIKGHNGLVVVQDPLEAEYDGMPQSAIATGVVDLVLPLAQIPGQIIRYAQTKPDLPYAEKFSEISYEEQKILQKIFTQIRARTSRDFSRYKISTIMRRIQRRMQLYQINTLDEYLEILRSNPDEVQNISNDFLITVTSFFRDPEVFLYLKNEILPRFFENKKKDKIRIWSVGCASGEEAYSLAILALEAAYERGVSPSIQIFASDLHETSLKIAREGFYPGDIEADVSQERLRHFFTKIDGGYRIRKEVRELVVFTPHNLMNDPPFSKMDMIVCRNLMIYLKRDVQPEVIELFHYALCPDGILVIGNSEKIDTRELFQSLNRDFAVYIKNIGPDLDPRLPVFALNTTLFQHMPRLNKDHSHISFGKLHQKMVEHYAPPSILLSQEHQILHVSENAGQFLTYPGGEPTHSIFKLLREELRIELRNIIDKARGKKKFIRSKPIMAMINGSEEWIIMSARITNSSNEENFILIIFEVYEEIATAGEDKSIKKEEVDKNVGNRDLEIELDQANQQLQVIIEEYDSTREEMKASNEELLSANEELHSTMEELETSREELQSMNEELITVNQENRHKVEELSQLSSDLQNLLSATDIATLFLDKNFRIMRFTPKLEELFSILSNDRGRPITDLTHKLGYKEMIEDARQVLKKLIFIEKEIHHESGSWFLVRLSPYRSTHDRIEGVVITFVEITNTKKAEEDLRESEENLRQTQDLLAFATEASQLGWGTWDLETGKAEWDIRSRKILGLTSEDNTVDSWMFRIHPGDRDHVKKQLKEAASNERAFDMDYRIILPDNNVMNVHNTGAFKIPAGGSSVIGTGLIRDVTSQKNLQQQKDDFIAVVSHELKTPVAVMKGYIKMIEEDLRNSGDKTTVENLLKVDAQIKRIMLLINDLLDVSRIETGRFSFSKESFEFDPLVDEVIESMQFVNSHKLKKIGFAGKSVVGDRERTGQVIINLISNAVKFSPEKKEVIIRVSSENNSLTLSVQDFGIGIEERHLDKVFERFSPNLIHLTKQKGLGIGLFISAEIIRKQNGKIWVESKKGKGSTFSFSLPAANDNE